MSLAELPDFNFTETDVDVIVNSTIEIYQGLSGRTLAPGDPLIVAIRAWAYKYAMQDVLINKVAKGQFLKYAKGDVLDHLGAFYNTSRLPASFAFTTILFTLSTTLTDNKIIPAGTRIGPVDGDGTFYFSTTEILTIPAGEVTGSVSAVSNIAGFGSNNYIANQLSLLIDPIPFVESVTNTTTSAGGSDIETDDAYRYRIYIAPESFSVAGPSGAYEYFAKSASSSIEDVKVSSPTPGTVEVTVILQGGTIPPQDTLDAVYNQLNDRTVRPLTDRVVVQAPTIVNYDINATYYISNSDIANSTNIQSSVNQALLDFRNWQKSKLGRDVNPSELIARIRNAGALRVDVISPTNVEVDDNEIAQEVNVTFTFGGYTDG